MDTTAQDATNVTIITQITDADVGQPQIWSYSSADRKCQLTRSKSTKVKGDL